jgi:hypothetical protein
MDHSVILSIILGVTTLVFAGLWIVGLVQASASKADKMESDLYRYVEERSSANSRDVNRLETEVSNHFKDVYAHINNRCGGCPTGETRHKAR